MAQIVTEFLSGSVEAIVNSIIQIVEPKTSVRILGCAEHASLRYYPTTESLEMLVPQLAEGALCSAVVYSSGDFKYGLVACPGFNGQPLKSLWMGTIELATNIWQPVWGQLLQTPEFRVVCVSLEEGIDLTDDTLLPSTFPWKDPSLIAGAVRRADGSWDTGQVAVV